MAVNPFGLKELTIPDSQTIANPNEANSILGFYNEIARVIKRLANYDSGSEDRMFVADFPDDKAYGLWLKSPYAFTISSVTSKSSAGTATATVKINGTALGGTANSVSTSEQSQAHTSDNSVAIGDDVTVEFSSVSGCEDAQISVEYSRV